MDARRNPFTPGNGRPPPELAGRDALIERAASALDLIRGRKTARSVILYGLRGIGKTVLLRKIRLDAEARGIVTVVAGSPEGWSLPALLIPPLRLALMKLGRTEAANDSVRRALRALAGFANLKTRFGDLDVALDLERESGLADSGDLGLDLAELLIAVGEAAVERDTAIVLFIDELQYVVETQLAALIGALQAVNQRQLPVTMVGAGLPQLLGASGRAKSYAERLFEFVAIDRLEPKAATDALQRPIEREGASIDPDALAEIVAQTLGYPYFLQEWGKHSWDVATASVITLADVRRAGVEALAELDNSFFGFRFDRLTQGEKRYLRALADLGPGSHRSRDIAERLGRKVNTTAPMRSFLITKGVLYSSARGDTSFTVPLFDQYLRRKIPNLHNGNIG